MAKKIKLKQLDKTQLHLLVKLLNTRPATYVLKSHNLTNIHQQELWLDKISSDRHSRYFSIHYADDAAIGFGGIEDIDWISRSAQVFQILERTQDSSDILQDSMQAICELAFRELGLCRVSTEILAENSTLIKTYEKIGFLKEVRKRQHYFANKSYHHIVEMAMLSTEYLNGSKYSTSSN